MSAMARPYLVVPLAFAAFLAAACAPNPSTRSSAAGRADRPLDAVLPTGGNLFLFDFVQGRYQRWSSESACLPMDSLQARLADRAAWMAYGTPGTPFAPVRATAGTQGSLFLLDRLGRRLALYDTNAQILSWFPLPQELKGRSPEKLEVYRSRDGLFTFLDPADGQAWRFAESRLSGDQGEWRLVQRIRLPVGLEDCLWEPFLRTPCCRVRSREGGGEATTRCFDAYLNPRGPWEAAMIARDSARSLEGIPERGWTAEARPQAGGPGWSIRLTGADACADGKPAATLCHETSSGTLAPCPAEPGTPGGNPDGTSGP
jgi:hypothetical protein